MQGLGSTLPMKGPLPNKLGTTTGVPLCDDESVPVRGVPTGDVASLEEFSLWSTVSRGLGFTVGRTVSSVYP